MFTPFLTEITSSISSDYDRCFPTKGKSFKTRKGLVDYAKKQADYYWGIKTQKTMTVEECSIGVIITIEADIERPTCWGYGQTKLTITAKAAV